MTRKGARPGGDRAADAGPTTAEGLAAQFQASFRTLWLIAVGIVGDPSLAEDVVQEAAIIALGKVKQFRPGSNFQAWTGQIVRNVALNHARRERRHRAASVDPIVIEESVPQRGEGSASGTALASESSGAFDARVVEALRGVGDVARVCLLLRTLDGMEYSQISRVLGIPEGTAMSHVHRSRQYLRKRLADLGTEQDAGSTGVVES